MYNSKRTVQQLINEIYKYVKTPGNRIITTPFNATFEGVLNLGAFVFDSEVEAFQATPGTLNVIENISFSANIDQLTFSRALDSSINNGVFLFDILKKGNNNTVLNKKIPFSSFQNKLDISIFFMANATNSKTHIEKINFDLNGQLLQTAEMLEQEISNPKIFVQATIYQINDANFIKSFMG